ncbi:MAG TPA: hypothetical protein VF142_10265 [Longimicrobium sp.]
MRSPRIRRALLLAGVAAVAVGTTAAIQVSELSVARMAQPFVGGTAPPLSAQDRLELDQIGNSDGVYDIGDVRRILSENPQLIPNGVVQLSSAPR